MKRFIHLLAILLLLLPSSIAYASHAVGGDIEYESIGPRSWKIRLTIYRDCTGATLCSNMGCTQSMVAKPNIAFNPGGCSVNPNQVSFNLSLKKVEDISKTALELCGSSAKNGCTNINQVTAGPYTPSVEKYIFEGTLDLSYPSLNNTTCRYWDVYWTLCCRNANIWNLASSSGQDFRIGATIDIFNRSVNPLKNNSPIIKNEPVIVVCANQEIVYNLGGIDPDGDLLTYEIAPSLQSSGLSVNYQPPGSATYPFPLNSSKAPHINYPQQNGAYVIIDSITGTIRFNGLNNTSSYTPGNLNVRIKQWTNDANGVPILVGITQRDVQMFLVNCAPNNAPKLTASASLPNNNAVFNYEVNEGQQLCFTVTAKDSNVSPISTGVDTTYISWDSSLVRPGKLTFGPTYTIGAGQRPREDQWQFCWQTDSLDGRDLPYTFTVTAIDKSCPSVGKTTQSFSILVKQAQKFSSTKTAMPCGTFVYKLYKTQAGTTINSATFQITTSPNDKSFSNGTRNIPAIITNPIAALGDTLNQPRLMLTDTFRYIQPGKYYTRLHYTIGSQNYISPFVDSIEVGNNLAQSYILANKPTSFCKGDSVLLSAQYTHAAYKYQWMLNNVNLTNATKSNLKVDSIAGAYSLIVTDTTLNCINNSNPITVQVNPYPVANFYTARNCIFTGKEQIFYDISTISSGSKSSTWKFGDNYIEYGSSIYKTFNSKGTIDIKLVSTSNFGCKDSIIKTYIIDTSMQFAYLPSSSICDKDSALLSLPLLPNYNYRWLKTSTPIEGANLNTYAATTAGNYRAIYTNLTNNCFDTTSYQSITIIARPIPVPVLSPTNLCINNGSLYYNDQTANSGNITRKWSFGDSTFSTNLFGNKLYTKVGSYEVKLVVSNSNGCKDSLTKIVNVNNPPVANISANSDTIFCEGNTIQLSNIYYPNATYYWYRNNQLINNADTNNLTVTLSGSYKLIIDNGGICRDTSNIITVQVYPKPKAEFTLNGSIQSITNLCSNSGLIFNDSSTIQSGSFTRLWSFGDGTTANNKSGNKLYNGVGSYTIKLILTSNNQCADSLSKTININSAPIANISASSSTSFCEGKLVNLSNNIYPNATYYWYRNNQLINNVDTNNLSITLGGSYKLIVDNGQNCKDTSNTITVQVYPKPKVGFTVNNAIQCLNNNQFLVTDTSSVSSGSISRTFTWGSSSSSLPSLNLNFATIGNHQVQLKATSNNGCSDSISKTITVSGYPTIDTISGLANALSTQLTYNYAISAQPSQTYNWSLTNGSIISGQGTNNITAQWTTPGTGQVKAAVTNANGCSKDTSKAVTILNFPPFISFFTPQTGTNGTVVTINGGNFTDASAVTFGGVNAKSFNVVSNTVVSAIVDTGATGSVSVVTPSGTALLSTFTYTSNTGVAEYVTQSYSIFPNPVSSEIIIESNQLLNQTTFELIDANGKIVISKTCNNAISKYTIDVKELNPSIYLLRITSNGQSNTIKIIKQ